MSTARSTSRTSSACQALKAVAGGLLHKSDAGGVALGLDGVGAVRAAAADIEASVNRADHPLDGLVVQPMAERSRADRRCGPRPQLRSGARLRRRRHNRRADQGRSGADHAGERPRSGRDGPLPQDLPSARRLSWRRPCDLAAIEDVLIRVSAMVHAHPEIAELDCNPLIAGPTGATIVDARVRVAVSEPPPPSPSLRA